MKFFLHSTLIVLLFTTGLSAQETESTEEKKHVPVGERRVSLAEEMKLYEQQWEKIKEYFAEQGIALGEEGIVPEEVSLPQASEKTVPSLHRVAVGGSQPSTGIPHSLGAYYIQHAGAHYYPAVVAFDGSTVELHDGSIWSIRIADRLATLNWYTNDPILVTQNNDLFSLYKYRLINMTTGAAVRTNLTLGPIYNGVYTYWITWIDYDNRLVFLNDGSCFQVSIWDNSSLHKWIENDTIIIGVNSQFDKSWNPHILLNVTWGGHVKAEARY